MSVGPGKHQSHRPFFILSRLACTYPDHQAESVITPEIFWGLFRTFEASRRSTFGREIFFQSP